VLENPPGGAGGAMPCSRMMVWSPEVPHVTHPLARPAA